MRKGMMQNCSGISFKDLNFSVREKKILKNLSGQFKEGFLTAMMVNYSKTDAIHQ